jgi:hypothetical protein
VTGWRYAPAELLRHRLHAVADAQHRHAELEHSHGRLRRFGVDDGLRSTRQHDAAWPERAHVRVAHVPRMDLAIDARLAHATRDELCVLRAEIEDQDAVGVDVGRSQRDRCALS